LITADTGRSQAGRDHQVKQLRRPLLPNQTCLGDVTGEAVEQPRLDRQSCARRPRLFALSTAGQLLVVRPRLSGLEHRLQTLPERVRIVEVELAHVLVPVEPDQPQPIPHRRLRQPSQQRLAALVGLDDQVNGVDAVEMGSVSLLRPGIRARDPKRRDLVQPQRLRATLALDQYHVAGSCRQFQPLKPVEAWLAALLPHEPLVALLALGQGAPDPRRQLDAVRTQVRHSHRWCTRVADLRQTKPVQELDWQLFRRRVLRERQPRRRLHGCTTPTGHRPPSPPRLTGLESKRDHDLLIGAPARAADQQRLAVLAFGHIQRWVLVVVSRTVRPPVAAHLLHRPARLERRQHLPELRRAIPNRISRCYARLRLDQRWLVFE
jgi:hypothetical protein